MNFKKKKNIGSSELYPKLVAHRIKIMRRNIEKFDKLCTQFYFE